MLVVTLPPDDRRGAVRGARLSAERVHVGDPPKPAAKPASGKPAGTGAGGGAAGAAGSAAPAGPLKQAKISFGKAAAPSPGTAAASLGTPPPKPAPGKAEGKRAAAAVGTKRAAATAKAEDGSDGSDDEEEASDEEGEYEVEAILSSRPAGQTIEYLVKCATCRRHLPHLLCCRHATRAPAPAPTGGRGTTTRRTTPGSRSGTCTPT